MLKWYNPNKFSILDAGIAYFAAVALFAVFFFFGRYFPSFSDYYLEEIIYAIIIQGVLFLIAFGIAKGRKVDLVNGGGYKSRGSAKDLLLGVVFIIGVLTVFAPLAELFVNGIFTQEQQDKIYPAVEGNYLYMFLYMFVISTMLPAVCEEFLMRGVVLRGVESGAGKYAAVAVSATLFMLLHRSPFQTIAQLAGGFALGFVMVKTRNILCCILMHFCNNLFAIFYSMAIVSFEQAGLKTAGTVILAVVGLACLAVGVYYFCLPEKWQFLNKKKPRPAVDYFMLGYYNSMGFKNREEFEEYGESLKGKYYYAVKQPDAESENGYADKTGVWREEIELREQSEPPAYFYSEKEGWNRLNVNTKRGKIAGIVLLALGAAACAAVWIYQLVVISSL